MPAPVQRYENTVNEKGMNKASRQDKENTLMSYEATR
jgi:hypothetical protein